jgi:formylglycine-generating enzyme required for sulfatase activity
MRTAAASSLLLLAASLTFAQSPSAPAVIRVPGGEFLMGDETHGGGPVRKVVLTRDFLLGVDEVTNAQYLSALLWAHGQGLVFVDESAVYDWQGGAGTVLLHLFNSWDEIAWDGERLYMRPAPGEHAHAAFPDGYDPADHPVKNVTWEGAAAYCDWLNLRAGLPLTYDHDTWTCLAGSPYEAEGWRLPTDAEWERAARGPDGRPFPWGEAPCDCTRANWDQGCTGWSTPVGSYPAGPDFGGAAFRDLLGNLWEWVHDWWWEPDPATVAVDPRGPPAGEARILRGTSWWRYTDNPRSALRRPFPPDYHGGHVGLRIARTAGTRDAAGD